MTKEKAGNSGTYPAFSFNKCVLLFTIFALVTSGKKGSKTFSYQLKYYYPGQSTKFC